MFEAVGAIRFKAVGAIRFEAVGAIFNTFGFSFSVLLVSYSYIFHAHSFVSILLAKQLFIAYAWVEPPITCQSSWYSALGNLRG